MFRVPLDDIEENYLLSLEKDQAPETMTTEFKRQLDLDNDKEKVEAAKDVSAMANTVGGRILYGINEIERADKSKVAGTINPLTDGAIQSRLEDILLSNIHPRPRFRMRQIPVTGGFVLVVEAKPAPVPEWSTSSTGNRATMLYATAPDDQRTPRQGVPGFDTARYAPRAVAALVRGEAEIAVPRQIPTENIVRIGKVGLDSQNREYVTGWIKNPNYRGAD